MKKIFSILALLLVLLVSCDKSEDFYEQLGKGAYLTIIPKGSSTNRNINATDPASAVSIKVGSYGEPVESVAVYVATSNTTDTTKWKFIKNVPFNSEADISVTNAQIATALGLTPGALVPGTIYNIYNVAVLKDGRRFGSYNNTQADLESQTEFNVGFRWTATVICPYDPATIAGTYEVITDDWEDWVPGDLVEVAAGSAPNTIDLSKVWPNPDFADVVTPLTISVDPATGTATIPSNVTFGNYGGYNAITGVGNTGFVFSCTGRISLRIRITATGFGDQGFRNLVLQKQ